MKVMAFIQARMGSTRLPGKTLIDLNGKPVLWYVIDRASKIKGVDKVVVLTSDLDKDDPIEEYCSENNISCFRGDELNPFKRFRDAAMVYKPDVIIRLTSDNPFIDIKIAENALKLHLESEADYTSTRDMDGKKITKKYYPSGFSIDIFNANHLFETEIARLNKYEIEHIIPYFYNRRDKFKISFLKSDLTGVELNKEYSIDTQEDLDYAEKILNHINWNNFTFRDIIKIGR